MSSYELDPSKNIVSVALKIRKNQGGVGELVNEVVHVLESSADGKHHVQLCDLINQQLKFIHRVLVRDDFIVQLAYPDKAQLLPAVFDLLQDRKSTRLNSSHGYISY